MKDSSDGQLSVYSNILEQNNIISQYIVETFT